VATGLAEYFNLDVALVRLIVVVASIVSFPVVPLAYVAAWIIIPRKDPAPTPPVMTAPVPMTDQVTPTAPTDTVTPPVDSLSGK
jgi:phage shock protein PspC (stress-responsive transcriptional regulator)